MVRQAPLSRHQLGPSRADPLVRSVEGMTALLLAALSAVLYGAGVAVEHQQAARIPAKAAGLHAPLLARLARQPLWLACAALEAGGFAAHAAALRTGSLAAVQMVLGCSLLVSIAVSSGLAGAAAPPLLAAHPRDRDGGRRHPFPARAGGPRGLRGAGRLGLAALVTGMITVPIAAAGLLATRRQTRALLLAVAAGLADTCAAVVTMAFTHSFTHGLGAAVTSWPPYALIVAGLASLALAETAYQTNAPLITLPTITAVMPLASLAVGIVALHETAHLNGARTAIMVACLALLSRRWPAWPGQPRR